MPSERKPPRRWFNIPIHKDLRDRATRLLESPNNPGYKSVADMANDALRRRLEELEPSKRAADLARRLDDLKPDTDRAAAKIRAGGPGPRGKFCHKCGHELFGPFCSNCGTPAVSQG